MTAQSLTTTKSVVGTERSFAMPIGAAGSFVRMHRIFARGM